MGTRVFTCLLIVAGSHALAQDRRVETLSDAGRRWVEEEVVYIITEREREAFLSLESEEERSYFIDAFWRKRDPNPITPVNEFQQEHYRRLAHANANLDDQSILPGWRTERGRIYIILGEPRNVERFNMDNRLVTTELWFYEGDTRKGLPPYFNLIFFKRLDTGEFRLYDPSADGPAALVRGRFGVQSQVALETINRISPELARASLSIAARAGGDLHGGIASLENETTMMRIEDSPKYAVRSDYLDGWERYGRRVAAEYSFNYVRSRGTFAVLPSADGTPFLHFGIELDPENFSLESDRGKSKFYTTLDVSVEVRGRNGTLVLADDKETFIELNPSQLEAIRMAPVAYQDSFPLVPGEYEVTVIFRNRVHSRFTVAETELLVPSFGGSAPMVSDIVLGHLVENAKKPGTRTFQLHERRVHPSGDRAFTQQELLHAMFRIVGAGIDDRLRLTVAHGEEIVSERETRTTDYPGGVVCETFALSGMPAGEYRLLVELLDEEEARVAEAGVPFRLSPRTAIPRPSFIVRRHFPAEEPGRVALARAEQLMALDRFEEAVRNLESAVAAGNPNLPKARWQLAGAYNRRAQPERALDLLLPMASAYAGEFEVSIGLGVAYYIQEDFTRAVPHLERAMAIRPLNASQLNALGNSYVALGRFDDARATYERSLALKPTQKSVEDALAALDNGS